MPDHRFEHLPLVLRTSGPAKLIGGGKQSDLTKTHKHDPESRRKHSEALAFSCEEWTSTWRAHLDDRAGLGLPQVYKGIPLSLKVDTSLDLDLLRRHFDFEIVAEQEDGFVLVASADVDLGEFRSKVSAFADAIRGSAAVASVHQLIDSEGERLRRILSDELYSKWAEIQDEQPYLVDIGISCTGSHEIPSHPKPRKRESDAAWAIRVSDWALERTEAYEKWDELKQNRENQLEEIVGFYEAEIIQMVDGQAFDAGVLPDSFTARIQISGKGLKDVVHSCPYVFEVVEPDDVSLPQRNYESADSSDSDLTISAPPDDAPAVCIIDSGIQEAHRFLSTAIDTSSSRCFLPETEKTAVEDFIRPGGHGTRVAGAVLFGERVPRSGRFHSQFWLQNARILDETNHLPARLFPPAVLRTAIEHFNSGPRSTRIFNHSINATRSCMRRYMSSWAAEIDMLCNTRDVLVIQSVGNVPVHGSPVRPGLVEHLAVGRNYPEFLNEPSSQLANPAQSLQALTVGSVAYEALPANGWEPFARFDGEPSCFSRSGFGIWDVIKPEVVEYGGDNVRSNSSPPRIGVVPESCPELVRSTAYPPGPAFDRDEVGSSFAAPKVARIAAEVQRLLPSEPTLLYRALIVQSARWPAWAEAIVDEIRAEPGDESRVARLQAEALCILKRIGFGIPDVSRATTNTDYRTTYTTTGETMIGAGDCHIYQVPIPEELRRPSDEFAIRIEVTLSYVAQPRRTRRYYRRYLSTWVDWKSSRLGEDLDSFRARALKDEDTSDSSTGGMAIPWTIHERSKWGAIREARRNCGTVQKDWAIVKSNTLPDHFGIAIVGHQGWSTDPDSAARYVLTASFEAIGQEIPIYEPLRAAVLELQAQIEPEIEI